MISTYLLFFYWVCQKLKLRQVDRAWSGYTWLLKLSEIRSSCEGRLDDSVKERERGKDFWLARWKFGQKKENRWGEETSERRYTKSNLTIDSKNRRCSDCRIRKWCVDRKFVSRNIDSQCESSKKDTQVLSLPFTCTIMNGKKFV